MTTELPAQQSALALHCVVCRRQTAPAGSHACPFVHLPTGAPPGLLHVTFAFVPSGWVAEPQQSSSSLQSSPVGRHPLGGWQTITPLPA